MLIFFLVFLKLLLNNTVLIWKLTFQIEDAFSMVPPPKCRMYANLTFFEFEIKSLYKHIPMFWERHCLWILKIYIHGRKEVWCTFVQNYLAIIWQLLYIIFQKMIVLHNRCFNLCPEKCKLGQISIASQKMCLKS